MQITLFCSPKKKKKMQITFSNWVLQISIKKYFYHMKKKINKNDFVLLTKIF